MAMKVWRRIVWILRGNRDDLADELEFHRAEWQAALERSGMPPGDARVESRRRMGNLSLAREDARAVWLTPWTESVWQDAAYGLRLLRRAPSFAFAIITVTALGIGATTTIFSLLDALVLKDLPVREPARLVYFKDPAFSYPIYQQVQTRGTAVLSGVAAWSVDRFGVQWRDAIEPGDVLTASGNFYSLLGVSAATGRLLEPDDDRVGGGLDGRVAVLSHDAWRKRFSGDPAVIGHVVRIASVPFTIVGVAPEGFFGVAPGLAPELTVPIGAMNDSEALAKPSSSWLHLIARLRDGLTLAQANAALAIFWPATLEATTNTGMPAERRAISLARKTALVPARTGFSGIRNRYQEALWSLFALVTLLLIVACASAANLWLARGAARRREVAVRLALGAGRWRIVRQMLTEAALTTTIGAAAGAGLASWGGAVLVAMMSTSAETISLDLRLSARSIAFTAALIVAATALGAIVPALRSTRPRVADSLRAQGAAAAAVPARWSQPLVALQIALTAALLIGAALFVRNLNGIVARDAGFDRRGVLVVSSDPLGAGYTGDRLRAFYDTLARRLGTVAGAQAVSVSLYPPISDQMGLWTQTIGVDGGALQADLSRERTVYFNAVSPSYFQTTGIRLLHGRDFTASDVAAAARVVIVNESLARSAFPGQNPIGHRISIGRAAARRDLDIIGLVADSKYQRLQEPARRIAYLPFAQVSDLVAGQNLVAELRVTDVKRGRADVVRAIRDVDPIVPLKVESIDDRIRESLVRERIMATLATALGLMALLLACAAVYGLLSYTVARRTSEFGVRVALGASRADVAALVLGGSAPVVSAGLAAGFLLAAGLGRFVRTLLFELQPLDPVSFAAAGIVVFILTTAAALLPARRAATVDPVVALRTE